MWEWYYEHYEPTLSFSPRRSITSKTTRMKMNQTTRPTRMVMKMTKTAAMRPSSFNELEVAAAGTALRAATVNALEADSANVRSVEMVCVAMNVKLCDPTMCRTMPRDDKEDGPSEEEED